MQNIIYTANIINRTNFISIYLNVLLYNFKAIYYDFYIQLHYGYKSVSTKKNTQDIC